uniref:Regulatory protein zeste n=1 Tax=Lygus hesperus TaxID=30085 RepID=A0A0K8TE07_LYGHE
MMGSEVRMHSYSLLAENNKQSDKPAKRIRLQNFTEQENELLIHLAHQEVAILENKTINAETNNLKTDVWNAITEVFNSHRIGERRDMASLRHRYENLKRKLRKKILNQKELLAEGESVQIMTTNYEAKLWEMMGGSKPDGVEILNDAVIEINGSGRSKRVQFIPAEDLEEVQAEILGISYESQDSRVSPMTVKGDASRDSIREEVVSDEEEDDDGPHSKNTTSTLETTTSKNSNKNNVVVNPSELRRYLSSAGRLLNETLNRQYRPSNRQHSNSEPPKPKPTSATVTVESADTHRFREEEHQLKMKNLKEEHEAKMKILTQELKMKEEEHALRMKILKRKLIVICEDI